MSPITTRAPSRTSSRASASPCPRAPPEISTTFPSTPPMRLGLPEQVAHRPRAPFAREHLESREIAVERHVGGVAAHEELLVRRRDLVEDADLLLPERDVVALGHREQHRRQQDAL